MLLHFSVFFQIFGKIQNRKKTSKYKGFELKYFLSLIWHRHCISKKASKFKVVASVVFSPPGGTTICIPLEGRGRPMNAYNSLFGCAFTKKPQEGKVTPASLERGV